ncbi:hypothetical protein Htur_3751 [Haloterrigena turkmenica DSM 5511]|uniref:Uncharacterized protein n=1 Tax=Haloterrigena turkmenica (strain ATCC 51198 / DSM 5511 / JCM 9101 / NCIMB 13204 / VKM B-1734 / 4k) TaxID=543526 RepID=D2RRZ6_HALTV|nr:hypothetical protein [Haloterrigena turkmenica]ADB62613.1 hypothetical protein Htur_3751 [Haloterrigena turkmenica DSM 5511]
MELEIVDDLRQPAYTGENRCEPCTILNLAIAAAVGSLIARKSRLGGALAVGVSIALIYLRGYLVPGTPTLTKRYLPPEVLRWFGKEPEPELASGLGADAAGNASGAETTDATDDEQLSETADVSAESSAEAGTTDSVDPDDDQPVADLETYFLEHEVLEPCAEEDDLCLTDAFESAWLEAIEAGEESSLEVADVVDAFGFDADADAFELDARDDVHVLRSERGMAGRWPSRAALLADVGASRALAEWTDDWEAHDPELKGQILNGLRMFLETCPTGGEISMSEETVESCCTSHEVFAVTCDETGERLFEQRLDAVDV